MKNNHLVIMAGGVGSRFWPMSSEECPKQFLDVLGCGRTLLQLTVDRFEGIIPMENIWVVTSERYKELTAEQLPQVPANQILLEPMRRNTAPCICYASWRIKKKNPRANVVVAPSDHVIADVEMFRSAIADAMEFSAETDAIVTLGIQPDAPETGYGYIEADLSFSSSRKRNIFRVDKFHEKPSREVAEEYLRQPNYFWNSGMFVWNVSTIVNAFRVYEPQLSDAFEGLLPYYGTSQEKERIAKVYAEAQPISVDYAIMERAEEIFVYPAKFGWSDLGTWGSLRKQAPQDNYGNAVIGDNVNVYDTRRCIIHAQGARQVVVQGLEDCIVAEKDGILLICRLSEEQRIGLFH